MVRPLKSWISPWKIFRRFEMVGKRVTFDDEQGSLITCNHSRPRICRSLPRDVPRKEISLARELLR
jgi:hypothetical protein